VNDLHQRVCAEFHPRPLAADESDPCVELDRVRGTQAYVLKQADHIRFAAQPTCRLLAGHDQSGKSTELLRLKTELETGQPRCFVVYCQIDEDVNRYDVDFPDVLIAIVRQIASQIRGQLQIDLRPGLFSELIQGIADRIAGIELRSFDLDLGIVNLAGAVKSSPDARQRIREALETSADNGIRATNDLLGDAKTRLRTAGYDRLVVIADDLDKMAARPHGPSGISTAEYRFVHRAAELNALDCHVVSTAPLALITTAGGAVAARYGGPVPLIPMTKLRLRPPKRDLYEPGMARFREIIEARLRHAGTSSTQIFATDVVRDDLIRLSGGQPGALMSLVRDGLVGRTLPVDAEAVTSARSMRRRAFSRHLLREHWPTSKAYGKMVGCGASKRPNASLAT